MPRAVSTPKELGALRQDLLDAALRILREQGAPSLTLRRVADAAATSTMGIYTCFGSRAGLLEAIYEHGFHLLHEALTTSLNDHTDPPARIMAIAYGYRRFALTHPALYALMFERPLPDFDPSPEQRHDALRRCFGLLVEATTAATRAGLIRSSNPERSAYLVWTTIHGLVSIELTCSLRTPLPGWFLNSREEGERILTHGIQALLAGLT
ncbi:TetR/AcrR family transcriptional regulator [Nonomuraea rubra]|uniref:TetR/AcrR family transcriptional regulator n=1 Tax=Nonomuraea rubra TaxID=46180 RepID=UPI0033CFFA33